MENNLALLNNIPADLIADIACGVEEPEDIRVRHGITDEQWELLKEWPPFLKEISTRRKELDDSGASFRMKSRLKGELLSDRVFVRTMAADAPLGGMMAALEHYIRVGDLAPKQTLQTGIPGSAFSITINLPGPKDAPGATFEHMPKETLPIYMRESKIETIEVK